MTAAHNPAALSPPDPRWAPRAEHLLHELRVALVDLPGTEHALLDHIGSTSVPGLAAKPFLDLQLRILPLPADLELSPRLAPLGWTRAQGSRPDSPGVHRDLPRGGEPVGDEVWRKSLWIHASESAVLHVRRLDSPWGRYTVDFRDWLRAHPDERERYADLKHRLADLEVGKADFDDYTRAKTVYFDAVQTTFEAWSRTRDGGSGRAVPPAASDRE
ncbi:GrpB family protein [Serinibacter arcticus]|uniref:GrpB family protein n=1 Tax=Serinibacter arcticus TaxID=1655435 RepID=A0A2U1ZWV0_9MICO|nr:GrpB family protein [Serinibacter arcticus]PWD51451.1 GrpB family protein [Serinibacter arcticus]